MCRCCRGKKSIDYFTKRFIIVDEENNKIKVGDQISTTGVGGVYPKNISIGKVKEIKHNDFDTSLYAVVEPYENIKTVSDIVVITSFKGQGEVSVKED